MPIKINQWSSPADIRTYVAQQMEDEEAQRKKIYDKAAADVETYNQENILPEDSLGYTRPSGRSIEPYSFYQSRQTNADLDLLKTRRDRENEQENRNLALQAKKAQIEELKSKIAGMQQQQGIIGDLRNKGALGIKEGKITTDTGVPKSMTDIDKKEWDAAQKVLENSALGLADDKAVVRANTTIESLRQKYTRPVQRLSVPGVQEEDTGNPLEVVRDENGKMHIRNKITPATFNSPNGQEDSRARTDNKYQSSMERAKILLDRGQDLSTLIPILKANFPDKAEEIDKELGINTNSMKLENKADRINEGEILAYMTANRIGREEAIKQINAKKEKEKKIEEENKKLKEGLSKGLSQLGTDIRLKVREILDEK